MHKTERSSWKPTEDSCLQVYQINRSAEGRLIVLGIGCTGIPGMLPDG